MLFNEDTSNAQYQITAYGNDSVTVGKQLLTQACLVLPEQLITDVRPQSLAHLTEDDLSTLLLTSPEILIIGSGNTHQFLPGALRYYLETRNIGVECMTTPAACRSYMALLAEARNVAALLFLG